jgi:hypothetical protein
MQMLNRTIRSAVAALVALLAMAGSAGAFTITAGDIKFTIDSYDSGTVGYGNTDGTKCLTVAQCDAVPGIIKAPGSIGSVNPSSDTMGIFSIGLITNISTGQVLFTKGVDGFLTGIFGNLSDSRVDVFGCLSFNGCSTIALSEGGTFRIWKNLADPNPALGPLVAPLKDLNNNQYPGINPGSQGLYLSGVFSPGVLGGDFTHTYLSAFNNNTFGGNGQGFLDLTGGSAFNTFNTNSLSDANGVKHDLFLTVTFDDVNQAASSIGWTVTNAGQVKGAAIPEPGSLALLVLGGFVAGWAFYRRKVVHSSI